MIARQARVSSAESRIAMESKRMGMNVRKAELGYFTGSAIRYGSTWSVNRSIIEYMLLRIGILRSSNSVGPNPSSTGSSTLNCQSDCPSGLRMKLTGP